ncbi:MAG: ATP-binding protein [Bryobacteraceae bacterium]|nr:ATP-binding protein [Bryobacteraceae bacterium]
MRHRNLTSQVLIAVKDTPVITLNGPRQSGKSTLMMELTAAGYRSDYLTLDDLNLLSYVRADPQNFVEGLRGPVVIDEVQRVPDLLIAIKRSVDRERTPGRFLLTGSTRVLQLPKLAETLAGRMELLDLWPFSEGELAGVEDNLVDQLFASKFDLPSEPPKPVRPLVEALLTGGYPEVVERPEERRAGWFQSYLQTVIEREARDVANVAGLADLPRLLGLLAARYGGLLNYADLATAAAMPQTTLKRYLAVLHAVFLFHPVPPWSTSRTSMLSKSPKVYLNDSGLAAYLLGTDRERLEQMPHLIGLLLEQYVMSELSKQITWSRIRPALYHFRTHAGQEVDFVLETRAGDVVGIEVKATGTLSAKDWQGLGKLAELAGPRFRRGIILYRGDTLFPAGPNRFAVPIAYLQGAYQRRPEAISSPAESPSRG